MILASGDMFHPFETAELQFNHQWREPALPPEYFNLIVPHEQFCKSSRMGEYYYSFALYPTICQPSGAANLSRIDDFTIRFKLDQRLIDQIKSGKKIMFRVYANSLNILRIMSGMAGLAFYR